MYDETETFLELQNQKILQLKTNTNSVETWYTENGIEKTGFNHKQYSTEES